MQVRTGPRNVSLQTTLVHMKPTNPGNFVPINASLQQIRTPEMLWGHIEGSQRRPRNDSPARSGTMRRVLPGGKLSPQPENKGKLAFLF